MKRFFILLAMAVLIMIQFSCSNVDETGEIFIDIDKETVFGDTYVNATSGYAFVNMTTPPKNSKYDYYYPAKIHGITVSDNINFTLDYSMTEKWIGADEETYFKVCFNPKSSGDFTATVTIKTEERTYKHYLYGRGI